MIGWGPVQLILHIYFSHKWKKYFHYSILRHPSEIKSPNRETWWIFQSLAATITVSNISDGQIILCEIHRQVPPLDFILVYGNDVLHCIYTSPTKSIVEERVWSCSICEAHLSEILSDEWLSQCPTTWLCMIVCQIFLLLVPLHPLLLFYE